MERRLIYSFGKGLHYFNVNKLKRAWKQILKTENLKAKSSKNPVTHPAVVQLLGFHDNGPAFLPLNAPADAHTENMIKGQEVTIADRLRP